MNNAFKEAHLRVVRLAGQERIGLGQCLDQFAVAQQLAYIGRLICMDRHEYAGSDQREHANAGENNGVVELHGVFESLLCECPVRELGRQSYILAVIVAHEPLLSLFPISPLFTVPIEAVPAWIPEVCRLSHP